MEHQFDKVSAKIVAFNVRGLVEISCKEGRVMKSLLGLSIYLVSNDCNVILSGNIIFSAEQNMKGFPPKFIYGINQTLFRDNDNQFSYHSIVNTAIISIIGLCCCFVVCIVCIRVKISSKAENRSNQSMILKGKQDEGMELLTVSK